MNIINKIKILNHDSNGKIIIPKNIIIKSPIVYNLIKKYSNKGE